jgi:hypothetical protein
MCGAVSMLGFKHFVPETNEAGELTGEETQEFIVDQWVWPLERVPRAVRDIQRCPYRADQEVLGLCYAASLHVIPVEEEPSWSTKSHIDSPARGVRIQYPKVTGWRSS